MCCCLPAGLQNLRLQQELDGARQQQHAALLRQHQMMHMHTVASSPGQAQAHSPMPTHGLHPSAAGSNTHGAGGGLESQQLAQTVSILHRDNHNIAQEQEELLAQLAAAKQACISMHEENVALRASICQREERSKGVAGQHAVLLRAHEELRGMASSQQVCLLGRRGGLYSSVEFWAAHETCERPVLQHIPVCSRALL